jgi:hypothetical protein
LLFCHGSVNSILQTTGLTHDNFKQMCTDKMYWENVLTRAAKREFLELPMLKVWRHTKRRGTKASLGKIAMRKLCYYGSYITLARLALRACEFPQGVQFHILLELFRFLPHISSVKN